MPEPELALRAGSVGHNYSKQGIACKNLIKEIQDEVKGFNGIDLPWTFPGQNMV